MYRSHDTVLGECELVGVVSESGNARQCYDDSFGGLFVCCNEYGTFGVIRAQSWETAWEIMLDEFLTPVDQGEDVCEAYGLTIRSENPWPELGAPYYVEVDNDSASGEQDRMGPYPTEEDAIKNALAFISTHELNLSEGYGFMPNSGGTTGIVNVGHYVQIYEVLPADLDRYGIRLQVINHD